MVANLTCFHGVYLHPLHVEKADLLMAYFCSTLGRAILADERREYGGGLEKFEPRDLHAALVLDLTSLTSEEERQLIVLYHHFEEADAANADIAQRRLDEKVEELLTA